MLLLSVSFECNCHPLLIFLIISTTRRTDIAHALCGAQEEVRSIVRKRTQFEYAVRRRAPALADFLRYAQYEMNLDALRRKRRERAGALARETKSPPIICPHAKIFLYLSS